MDNIKDYDDEGFELMFEDGTTLEEKKYFVQAYSNVNIVADKRLHCTCCNTHIGTAPNSEKLIRMHPVLRVTQCVKCYRFYNSGEFEKGEDGSELYCRWCGQGGDVYCCSDCPYVFCKKCILRNLTKIALNNVTSNDNWKCFSCAPKILYHLRAQHWALVNFIAKQKKKIDKMVDKRDPDEIADAMSHDSSQCCQSRKKTNDGKKRKISYIDDDSDDDSEDSNWSTKKRNKAGKKSASESSEVSVAVPIPVPVPVAVPAPSSVPKKKPDPPAQAPPAKKVVLKPNPIIQKPTAPVIVPNVPIAPVVASTEAAEIDCTPDLFAYLVNHSYEQTHGPNEQSEASVSSSTGILSSSTGILSSSTGILSTIQAPSTSKNQPAPPPLSTLSQPQFSNNSNSIRIENVTSGQAANAAVSQGQPVNQQFVRRVARSTVSQASTLPVYHNYNGYRIDLNSAAQQSTIRLPNGKVIHVKKQTPINNLRNEPTRYSITSAPTAPTAPPIQNQPSATAVPLRRHPIQRLPTSNVVRPPVQPQFAQRMQAIQQQQVPPQPLAMNSVNSSVHVPTLQQIMPPRLRAQGPRGPMNSTNHMPLQDAQMLMQQQMLMQNQATRPNMAPPPQIANVTAGPSVSNALPQPKVYSNDQVGRARTQLERQVFNAISICHQIDGKLKTLMSSNAYKNAQKLHDIKELYIHLSYLFTYTNGRFQTVHDKCMEDMRRLGFKNDATSLSSGNVIDKYGSDVDEDDLEIVEPNHQTINLDSDDESRTPEKNRSKSNSNNASTLRNSIEMHTPEGVALSNYNEPNNSEVMLDISSSMENVECDVDVASLLQINMNVEEDDHGELLLSRMNEHVGIATPPETEEPGVISIENDLKLKSKATIELKPVEKIYPDLMKKALEKIRESQNADNEKDEVEQEPQQEPQPEPQPEPEQEPLTETNSLCQSQDINEKENYVENAEENDKEMENQLESTNDNENELQTNDDDDVICFEPLPDKTEQPVNEPKQNENKQQDVSEDEIVETQKSIQVEANTPREDADFNENEAKPIENSSDIGDEETSNQESHAEITSTSMVIENDVEMMDTINSPNRNDDKPDGQVENDDNDSNAVSTMDTADDAIVEVEAENQNQNETDSLFSDLVDINNAISTSDTLNLVNSILDNDDFENISSPENFN